jgi:hypothetical protein
MLLYNNRLPVVILGLALLAGCSYEEKVASPAVGADVLATGKSGSDALQSLPLDPASGAGLAQGDVSVVGAESAVPTGAVPQDAAPSVLDPVVENCGWGVSGTVYIDTDRDGAQDPSETGLPGVVVDLIGRELIQSAVSDAYGRYAFESVCTGSWTVAINLTTDSEAFNADLATSFEATSPLTRTITVGPDALGNDFGFVPDATRILADIADGDITTDGYTREIWSQFFRCAMHYDNLANRVGDPGNPGHSDHGDGALHTDVDGHRLGDSCACNDGDLLYDADALRALLADVEGLFLPEPFQFRDGHELREAYRLMSGKARTVADRVKRELLVTELNYLVGRGVVGRSGLVSAIAAWSESLLFWDTAEVAKSADKGRATTDLGDVLKILEAVNTGGGGGVDE